MSLTTVGVFTDTISFNVGFVDDAERGVLVVEKDKGADQSCSPWVERNLEVMSSPSFILLVRRRAGRRVKPGRAGDRTARRCVTDR